MPTAEIDGLRINYSEAGSGLPIVFVPGLAGAKDVFHYQFSGLSDHYRVISPDLRQVRGRDNYTLDLLVNDLDRFLTAIRLPMAVIAGHAFGSLIALKFAATRPQRCVALVVISGAPTFKGVSQEQLKAHMIPGEIKFESWFTRIWKRLVGVKQVREDDSGPLAQLARYNTELDSATLDARLRILQETDLTGILEEIIVPTLVLAAASDEPYVLSGSQHLYQAIDGSTLEVIEDDGHFCFFTRHDLTNSIIDEYLGLNIAQL